jgi:hypothetical protein
MHVLIAGDRNANVPPDFEAGVGKKKHWQKNILCNHVEHAAALGSSTRTQSPSHKPLSPDPGRNSFNEDCIYKDQQYAPLI